MSRRKPGGLAGAARRWLAVVPMRPLPALLACCLTPWFSAGDALDAAAQARDTLEADAYVTLSESRLREGQFAEADSLARAAAAQAQDDTVLERIDFLRAEIAYYEGDAARATDAYLLFLEEHPESRLANDAMERLLLIDENVGASPAPLAAYARAELLDLAGQPDSAVAVLDGLLVAHPTASIADDALLKKADLLRARGRYLDALSSYRLVEVRFPLSRLVPVCKLRVGDLYSRELRDNEKAVTEYEEIATQFPETSFAVEARSRLVKMKKGSAKRD